MLSLSSGQLPSGEFNNLKVSCYSGQTYAERPKSFAWAGVEYEVEEIEKEWLEPGERHFRSELRITNSFNSAIMRHKTSGR